MQNQTEEIIDMPENGIDYGMDKSVEEARWLLGMVVFLGLVVFSTGVVASAFAA